MEAPLVEARPAATVMLIRDSRWDRGAAGAPPATGVFGGLTVFPGGAVDPVDSSGLADEVVAGNYADQEFRVAALRELAEESGLALSIDGVVSAPDRRGEDLLSTLVTAGTRLDGSALTLVSRWITPEEAPTRYDTRFYVVGVDETPEVRIESDELVGHTWAAPGAALAKYADGTWGMFLPTIAHLRWLERRPTTDDAVAAAHGADGRSLVEPRRMEDGSFVPIHLPADG